MHISIDINGVDVTSPTHGRPILSKLNLQLSEPRIGIIGLNGSGKTTFARLLNGLQLPTRGSVIVDGLDTKKEGKKVRERVGFVFQNPEHQIVCPTVEEDLAFGLKNRKIDKHTIRDKIDIALKHYQLKDLQSRLTHELSAGEKQMIALIGVVLMSPKTVILDEPTALLDKRQTRRFMRAVDAMEQQVILVTHHIDLLHTFDRVIGFHKGNIFVDAAPSVAINKYEEIFVDAS